MSASDRRPIVVTGATGLQGGAVTRHLLRDGLACPRVDTERCEQAGSGFSGTRL
jgi:nucleoside-diphosphate-sugar epimerase